MPYAEEVAARLKSHRLRVEVDTRSERMNAKIRAAQLRKIPYMFVVGDREAEAQTASLRVRGGGNLGVMSLDDIVTQLVQERDTKALTP